MAEIWVDFASSAWYQACYIQRAIRNYGVSWATFTIFVSVETWTNIPQYTSLMAW